MRLKKIMVVVFGYGIYNFKNQVGKIDFINNFAHLNILVHDMMNSLYYEYWPDKQKYLYVYQQQGLRDVDFSSFLAPAKYSNAKVT